MRFKISLENLIIELGENDPSIIINEACALLVPRFTNKVYFSSDTPIQIKNQLAGLKSIQNGNEPSNFYQSFRIIKRRSELVVVSSNAQRFSEKQWKDFAAEISKLYT